MIELKSLHRVRYDPKLSVAWLSVESHLPDSGKEAKRVVTDAKTVIKVPVNR